MQSTHVPHNVIRAARMSLHWEAPSLFHTTPLQNQLLGGLCFSFISPGPVHASLINPAKFQIVHKTVPINWLFNQFDQKCFC